DQPSWSGRPRLRHFHHLAERGQPLGILEIRLNTLARIDADGAGVGFLIIDRCSASAGDVEDVA
ncbi:hypothetical protein ACCS96_34140, partial [Rhizobium ruizarguesonis]